jgi:PhnB protein
MPARVTAKEDTMGSTLNPYINFKDNAAQAMNFYKEVFGGELRTNTFGEYGQSGPDENKIMHAQLETSSGFTLMASDAPEGMPLGSTDGNMTISLSGDNADELRGYWDKLADGGTVTMPLEKQMWGDEFGMVTDKFGIPWMVNIAGARD